jgi:hypothetical protein
VKVTLKHPNEASSSVVREVAAIREVTFRMITTMNHPGDNLFEQLHRDGRGPTSVTTEEVVGFDTLAEVAAEALARIRASRGRGFEV